jgi:hypothetical protein
MREEVVQDGRAVKACPHKPCDHLLLDTGICCSVGLDGYSEALAAISLPLGDTIPLSEEWQVQPLDQLHSR